MKINCIIVDDEPASRNVLQQYVSDTPSLNLIVACKNAVEAHATLSHHAVQLMFLDINMPKISGLQFLKSLPDPPKVIFTTAYPEYAVDGFELNALDYLLKPFSFERFLKAVHRYTFPEERPISSEHRILFLKSDKKLYRIPLKDIVYLEALGDYVKVAFGESSIVVHSTFQKLLDQVADSNIMRIHRSFAIALDKFDYIDGNQIVVKGQYFSIGKAYKKNLLLRIQA